MANWLKRESHRFKTYINWIHVKKSIDGQRNHSVYQDGLVYLQQYLFLLGEQLFQTEYKSYNYFRAYYINPCHHFRADRLAIHRFQ